MTARFSRYWLAFGITGVLAGVFSAVYGVHWLMPVAGLFMGTAGLMRNSDPTADYPRSQNVTAAAIGFTLAVVGTVRLFV